MFSPLFAVDVLVEVQKFSLYVPALISGLALVHSNRPIAMKTIVATLVNGIMIDVILGLDYHFQMLLSLSWTLFVAHLFLSFASLKILGMDYARWHFLQLIPTAIEVAVCPGGTAGLVGLLHGTVTGCLFSAMAVFAEYAMSTSPQIHKSI